MGYVCLFSNDQPSNLRARLDTHSHFLFHIGFNAMLVFAFISQTLSKTELTKLWHHWMGWKAECWRIDAFELWCWRRLLRVSWTARSSDQSVLKEISPEYSLEGLMLKLKLQYFGHLMCRADSFEKTLMWERLKAGGGGDDRGWDGCMALPTQFTLIWASSRSWWWTGKPGVLQSMGLQRGGYKWTTELNWAKLSSFTVHLKLSQHC